VKVGSLLDETGRATESNCVAARRGGKQLEVDLQSQMTNEPDSADNRDEPATNWRNPLTSCREPYTPISLGCMDGCLWLR